MSFLGLHFSTHSRHCGFALGRPFCSLSAAHKALEPWPLQQPSPRPLTLTVLGAFFLVLLSHLFPATSPSPWNRFLLPTLPGGPSLNIIPPRGLPRLPSHSRGKWATLFSSISSWFSPPACAYRVTRVPPFKNSCMFGFSIVTCRTDGVKYPRKCIWMGQVPNSTLLFSLA